MPQTPPLSLPCTSRLCSSLSPSPSLHAAACCDGRESAAGRRPAPAACSCARAMITVGTAARESFLLSAGYEPRCPRLIRHTLLAVSGACVVRCSSCWRRHTRLGALISPLHPLARCQDCARRRAKAGTTDYESPSAIPTIHPPKKSGPIRSSEGSLRLLLHSPRQPQRSALPEGGVLLQRLDFASPSHQMHGQQAG